MARTAHLTEIFSSIQGEGPYTGVRQLFLRFYGCHLNCQFCDTPETVTARQPAGYRPDSIRIEETPGSGTFAERKNPVGASELLAIAKAMDAPGGLHHSVALTGGEPLVHVKFLQEFLPLLKQAGLSVYLETAGDLHAAFTSVQEWVDLVAMDIKLPSVTADRERWEEHEAFAAACAAAPVQFFAKSVVNADASEEEILRACRLLAVVDPATPYILQPMTPREGARNPPSPARLMALQEKAREILSDVRVMPQAHRALGAL